MPTRTLAAPLAALALLALPLAADPVPDDPWVELKQGQYTYIFNSAAGFDVPFLTIDDWDPQLGLPPGTCGIRFKDIDAWYWGDPAFMAEMEPLGVNNNVDLLYDTNHDGLYNANDSGLMDFDFVVENLPLPGCEGPLLLVAPLAQNGGWPQGATTLLVQTAPQQGYLSSNVEFLDANGSILEAPEAPEAEIPESDPCEIWPEQFICADDFQFPCDPPPPGLESLCDQEESIVQLAVQAPKIAKKLWLETDLLAGLFAADPSSSAIGDAVASMGTWRSSAETSFGRLRTGAENLEALFGRHPELTGQVFEYTRDLQAMFISLSDQNLAGCSAAVGTIERAHTVGGLNSWLFETADRRCTAAAHSLGRIGAAAEKLWTIGLKVEEEEEEE